MQRQSQTDKRARQLIDLCRNDQFFQDQIGVRYALVNLRIAAAGLCSLGDETIKTF